MNPNIMRNTVKSACKKHKILIIGDSHVRGLSEKISNCLNDSFRNNYIWVVNNIIKEIRNWKSSCRVSSPIELPWENEMNDLGNQVSPVIVSVGKEGLSPNCKNDGHPEPGDSAAVVDSLSQTDMECLGQT